MLLDLSSIFYAPKAKAKKAKKKKYANWFESCNANQLKELCKAAKLPVSGTKSALVQRLLTTNEITKGYGNSENWLLKEECKKKLLVQTGNKYDLMLRLLHAHYGTGTAKRAATETVTDEATGQQVQVLKKRAKTILKPASMYAKIKQKIHSVSQKKYQTHYGSKDHAPATYNYMRNLLKEQCIDSKLIQSDPRTAFCMAKAAFQAFYDHWPYMERPGYETSTFSREVMGQLEIVLRAFVQPQQPHLLLPDHDQEVESMVDLLESIEGSVSGYGLEEKIIYRRDAADFDAECNLNWSKGWEEVGKANCFVDAIRILRPSYQKENRVRSKPSRALYGDIKGVADMNGIAYEIPAPPTYNGGDGE